MVAGLFETIRQGSRGLSRKKRRRAAQGLFSLPYRLCIVVGDGLSNENECYDPLERLLATYRDMAAPYKPQNVAWPSLEVELTTGGDSDIFLRRARLCAVVQQFSLDGEVWDPVFEREKMEWAIYERGDPEGNEVQSADVRAKSGLTARRAPEGYMGVVFRLALVVVGFRIRFGGSRRGGVDFPLASFRLRLQRRILRGGVQTDVVDSGRTQLIFIAEFGPLADAHDASFPYVLLPKETLTTKRVMLDEDSEIDSRELVG
ncbi:hypothetical protein BV25DRAFT_1922464 [Artomyces pyxidatus]|uniref:Uncharacterized protein n=1 Tax=Artomyces pyxidatus TaxID=48021 RepID=A0ACB8SEC5_9AGAM|nr:hypothetical protein BV25DRAFT_1922464 [Artomyces pyxidatus]